MYYNGWSRNLKLGFIFEDKPCSLWSLCMTFLTFAKKILETNMLVRKRRRKISLFFFFKKLLHLTIGNKLLLFNLWLNVRARTKKGWNQGYEFSNKKGAKDMKEKWDSITRDNNDLEVTHIPLFFSFCFLFEKFATLVHRCNYLKLFHFCQFMFLPIV